ncbi:MAG TPA: aldose epimerase family protein [Albidovulum sp.]|uniref:aldose epimerase family protein n=1 Tax=Albidovulum sp. TaxID=1872424 RepID=UPI002CE6D34C|nr:aldose epimerase family protein [Albidovulum sp.]
MTGISEFGTTAAGQGVQAVTLSSGALTVRILTLGAILQDVRLAGVAHSLTLGSENLADYEGPMRFHGSLIAPVANRLSDGRAPIAGLEHRFQSAPGHPDALHSGPAGTHLKVWSLAEAGAGHVTLSLRLPDGEGGFPGNRSLRVTYSLAAPDTLRMEVVAETDRPTLFNVANHSYWNLDGSANWQGHRLRIAADHYLPADAAVLPTGEIAAVTGTAFDFREGRIAGPGNPPLDTCFCLSRGRVALRPVLELTGASGVRMALSTTEPGVQVYDGSGASRPGHPGGEGVAIEAQGWPDAPNHKGFPSVALGPGETYRQITEWRFARG